MTLEELKASLRELLRAEEKPEADWEAAELLIHKTLKRLTSEDQPSFPYNTVIPFLDDFNIRQKEPAYARVQRERLRAWLNEAD